MTVRDLINELKKESNGNLDIPVIIANNGKWTDEVSVYSLFPEGLPLKNPGCIEVSSSSWVKWKRRPNGLQTSDKYVSKPKRASTLKATAL